MNNRVGKYKKILRVLPIGTTVALAVATLITSLDGIVNAVLMGRMAATLVSSNYQNIVATVIFGVVAYAVTWTAMYVSMRQQNNIVATVNITFIQRYFKNIFEQKSVDKTASISKIQNDFKLLGDNFYRKIFAILQYGSMALYSVVLLLVVNWRLGIVFILAAMLPLLQGKLAGNVTQVESEKWSDSKSVFTKLLEQTLLGFTTIRGYQAEVPMLKRVDSALIDSEFAEAKMNNAAWKEAWLGWLLSIGSYMIPIAFGLYLIVSEHNLTGAGLIMMFSASDRVIGPIRNIMAAFGTMKTTDNLVEELIPLVDKGAVQPANSSSEVIGNISVRNVRFNLRDNRQISVPSFEVTKGAHVMIMGKSGIGKSTFLKLLNNEYQPDEGTITLENESGQIVTSDAKYFAHIGQVPFVFSGSLRENLTLGKNFTDDKLSDALATVGLLDELGTEALAFQVAADGSNLSGGQKQRIEVARALIFERSIILADEITAGLDANSAKKVRDTLYALPNTIIEVAHHIENLDLGSIDLYVFNEQGELVKTVH